MLSDKEQKALLKLAVNTLEAHLEGRDYPTPEFITSEMKEPRAAFVTWRKGAELRGCIGALVPTGPLWEAVREKAISAATADPRFLPIQADELPDLSVEISVLSPLRRIDSIDEIEIGCHGLWITKGQYSGVLLPQVASEHGWSRDEFIRMTCRKAGLPPDAWQADEAEIYVFSAKVFGDEVIKLL